ncbi:MAG: phospholipid carrier-dependent glycosyltransferase, partial [Phycisphaerae bacterium]|nr:phospholipid carrier-dependent glycosyltransferase [Phycisphaerae bacterium]
MAARPGSASLKIADRILLLALSLVLLLPGTWVSLTDRDEGYYGQVCREMLAGGDWLVPQYLGQPWLFKPPLLYWAASGAFTIFGLQEWAARLVSVLALAGAVQFLAALAADMYNRRTALIACACFLTAGLPLIVGRMLLTDPLLLLWMMAAVWLLWRIATRSAG